MPAPQGLSIVKREPLPGPAQGGGLKIVSFEPLAAPELEAPLAAAPQQPGHDPLAAASKATTIGAPPVLPKTSLGQRIGQDIPITLLKGAISVPEALVGLLDIPTGGRAGKALEKIGFRPGEAKRILDSYYTTAQQRANLSVEQADTALETAKAALSNPSVIGHTILESLPLMGAGGVAGRGLMAVAPRVPGIVAGAVGEGLASGGSTAEGIRQETPTGLLTAPQAVAAAASGAATSAFGVFGGRLAQRLGIADIDTMLAAGATSQSARKGLVRAIVSGAVQEGFLEELPQSVQEQVVQNLATGKPLDQGVNQALVLGTLAGAVMGGGVQAIAAPQRQTGTATGVRAQDIKPVVSALRDTLKQPAPASPRLVGERKARPATVTQPAGEVAAGAVAATPAGVTEPVPAQPKAAPLSIVKSEPLPEGEAPAAPATTPGKLAAGQEVRWVEGDREYRGRVTSIDDDTVYVFNADQGEIALDREDVQPVAVETTPVPGAPAGPQTPQPPGVEETTAPPVVTPAKAEVTEPAEAPAKEPWEMTKAEFLATAPTDATRRLWENGRTHYSKVFDALSEGREVPDAALADYPGIREAVAANRQRLSDLAAKQKREATERAAKETEEAEAKRQRIIEAGRSVDDLSNKEPWELTLRQFTVGGRITNQDKAAHRVEVERALREGKPVPDAVRAGYPDIQQRLNDIETGLRAWAEGRAYIDGAGNYRLHGKEQAAEITVYRGKGPIAPWSRAVKEHFKSNDEFHKAAQAYKPEKEPTPEASKKSWEMTADEYATAAEKRYLDGHRGSVPSSFALVTNTVAEEYPVGQINDSAPVSMAGHKIERFPTYYDAAKRQHAQIVARHKAQAKPSEPPTAEPEKAEPSADRYDELSREIQAIERSPEFRADTREGRLARDRMRDLEREREIHQPAAIAKAQAEIDAEKVKRGEPTAKPEPTAALSLPEPPPIRRPRDVPEPGSLAFKQAMDRSKDLEAQRQAISEDLARAETARNKHRRNSKAWKSQHAVVVRLRNQGDEIGRQAGKARDEAHRLHLYEAAESPDVPWEAKWGIRSALKLPSTPTPYEAIRAEATRRLREMGLTEAEAEREGRDVGSMLTSFPLSKTYWFENALPVRVRVATAKRAEVEAKAQFEALKEKYQPDGHHVVDLRGRLERAGTDEARADILKEAEETFRKDRERADASAKKAAARVAIAVDETIDTKGLKSAAEVQARVVAALEADLAKVQAAEAEGDDTPLGRIRVQIPGDGTFTLERTTAALTETLRRIKAEGPAAWRGIIANEKPAKVSILPGAPRPRKKPAATTGKTPFTLGEKVQYFDGEKWQAGIFRGRTPGGVNHVEAPSGRTQLVGDDEITEAPKPSQQKAPSGTASTGGYVMTEPPRTGTVPRSTLYPVQFPELVQLARTLASTPVVVKRFRNEGKRGEFRPVPPGSIRLAADLFKKGNEQDLAATLAHEIGHLVDWLPNFTLKRGNLLGRLQTLKSFLKHTFTAEDGTTIKLAEVREELLKLSTKWRPWDPKKVSASFAAYRRSSKELYADAISVLLNNPGMLEEEAPVFYAAFFEALDKKPEVRRAYFALQEFLSGTPEELIERRRTGVREMFEEGDYKAIELERLRQQQRKASLSDLWSRTKNQLLDKNYPLIDRVRSLQKRKVRVNPDDDPRYVLEERNYLGGKLKAFCDRHFNPIYQGLLAQDIDWTTFGEALFYDRIIAGDRSEVANPRGIQPEAAQQLADDLRASLRPEQRPSLDAAVTAFRRAVRLVADEAHEVGLYSDEMYADMKANPAYVTFRVIEHLEDAVSSRVYRQIGTLKDITNPADATMLKTLATIRAIEQQKVKLATFEFLAEHFPSDIQQAKEIWTGKGHKPIEPKDREKWALVTYYEKGKLRGKYVGHYVSDSITNASVGQNWAVISALRFLNSGLFRPVFTTFNVGFQTFNFWRDFNRFWKNIPGMTYRRAMLRYIAAIPLSRVRAFGMPKHISAKWERAREELLQAEESSILSVTFNDYVRGRSVEDTQVEETLARMGVGGFGPEPKSTIGRVAAPVLDFIERLGNFIETLPKAAAMYEFRGEGAISDIPPDVRSFIRRKVGSPDFLEGGTWKPVTNEFLLFSNAIKAALRADLEVATDPTTRGDFWYKTAKVNVLPKLILFGALAGLGAAGGDDEDDWRVRLRRLLGGISEYDLTNYIPIPLGLDSKGNTVYVRLPQDDSGRLIGGLVWKALHLGQGNADAIKTAMQVFDYTAGQVPSVTPVVQLAGDVAAFASGRNVYDPFRSRFLFTDDELRARDIRTLRKFIGYEFQQLGGGIVWKFYPGEQRPRNETVGQRILELPVLSTVVGRWIKISDYGETERLRETQAMVSRGEARARLSERSAVNSAIREYQKLPKDQQTPATVHRLARDVVEDVYAGAPLKEKAAQQRDVLKKIRMGLTRGEGDPVVDAVMGATSNAQKVAVLLEASRTTPSFRTWLAHAVQHQVISPAVYAATQRELARSQSR